MNIFITGMQLNCVAVYSTLTENKLLHHRIVLEWSLIHSEVRNYITQVLNCSCCYPRQIS